ncbi:MAG TPA: NADH-quinone oxidoreductase subunit M [Cytophagaceae bacterium]|jgi:NADH-quinone oxidoreductase subunit M|nr:NADH-quinone oxidoreductase subunit M [Cytophagaceae bacterium]
MLSLVVFLPFVSIFLIALMPMKRNYLYKTITLVTTAIQLILSLILFIRHQPNKGIQFSEQFNWIELNLGKAGKLTAQYFVGVDGINISMVLLTGIIMFAGALASWKIVENKKGYYILYLLLCSTIQGCFVALDFLLFFIFFEFMLLPMYFLIGLWGGPRREYASIKFFLYTLFGSIFILIVMIGLHISVIDPVSSSLASGITDLTLFKTKFAAGAIDNENLVHTFNMLLMKDPSNYIPGSVLHQFSQFHFFGFSARAVAFLALIIGFAIKLPVVPFHTWLPDAHVEAPTPISVVLAGILLKVGGYGMIRIAYPVFPEGAIQFAYLIGLFGIISIVYAGFNALAMKDLKKMIAYSSISHMGFVLLGMASLTVEGMNGAMYQMFSHGILAALLFLVTGVLYDRTHDRMIENYRGLSVRMPIYTSIVIISFFASFGLPGFSGFIAELLVLLGAFNAEFVNGLLPKWMAIVATSGILLGAVYYLWTFQSVFFGKFWIRKGITWKEGLYDLDTREKLILIPLAVLAVVFGLFPSILLDAISADLRTLVGDILTKR